MTKTDVSKNMDNFETYEEKIKNMSEKELEMFNKFYETIKRSATNHRDATLNNLHESKESLSSLKAEADKLKDSVFYHDETVIVDRQDVIGQTEHLVHKENRNILDYEYAQAGERIDSLDYLNKALIQTKFNLFDQFRDFYANQILDYDYLYSYFQDKTNDFDKVLHKYHLEIIDSFKKLDNEINDMDLEISNLIQEKNSQLNTVNKFYSMETKNYLDNQLTFSVEEDSSSLTIQALISDKISQLESFRNHIYKQEAKVKKILNDEYLALYEKTLDRLLKRKGNLLIEDINFFYHPEEVILKLKKEIANARENDFVTLKDLINKYNKAINYKNERFECEKRAKKLTRNLLNVKKEIFLEYQKDSRNLIFKLEKYYKLYLELLKIDPFLAQIIGDNSTKIIKDEINFLSILQLNKEHKINNNFDIKTLKLKQKINQVEAELAYQSERLMLKQDIELLDTIKDIQLFFTNHLYDSSIIMNSLTKEKYQIERLESAINNHMDYLVKESNVNRKFLSIITQILEANIREQESHNIKVVEATSKIKLALKEYDILALHFNTMYENEKRFLIMQSNRVSEETKINNEFVLTTFSNQMRFAAEQINLANDEYRLRVEAIMTAINEERNYYYDIVNNRLRKYKEREKQISDDYQAKLYHDSYSLTEATEKSYQKALEKQIAKNKKVHDSLIDTIEAEVKRDTAIQDAKRRLRELDVHFEEALRDAQTIRDDTIDEMNDLYHTAESKYNTLKPYLNSKINPLDPTFYNTLEKIKERHNYKLKQAQIELEEATKDLLNNYLTVYFQEKPEINSELYLSQIEQLEEEKQVISNEYSKKLQKTELMYHTKAKALDSELKNLVQKTETNKNLVLTKHAKNINQKENDIEALKRRYSLDVEKISNNFRNEITDLTNEYNQSLISNQKFYKNLNKTFDTILDSYYPYLKTASNNKVIKKIVKLTEKKINKQQVEENKKLVKDSKNPNYISG